VFALTLVATENTAAPQSTTSPAPPPGNSQTDVQREINRLNDALTEVRRDQLNYKIERDLLKNAYTSSFQTINVVLTMILGAFAVLGYLGLRGLGTLRGEFQRELEQFRTARSELDRQLATMQRDQSEAKATVDRLSTESQERDRRLRALEIREKAASQMSAGAFGAALDYLAVGLEFLPGDMTMMRQRASCLAMLGRGSEAVAALEAALQKDPSDATSITDLAEYYLLNGQVAEHNRLVGGHRDVIERRSPLLFWYFEAISRLHGGDLLALKEHVSRLLAMGPLEAGPKIPGFSFREARLAFTARKDLVGRDLFLLVLDFLEGRSDGSALSAATAMPEKPRQDAPPPESDRPHNG
jgi:tetratricopeptide (TPR) repeat protein